MPNQPTRQELQRLLDDLLRLDRDTEWAAFHAEPDWKALGPTLAALANSAALNEKPCGYLLCGVNAVTRTVDAGVATSSSQNFKPANLKPNCCNG